MRRWNPTRVGGVATFTAVSLAVSLAVTLALSLPATPSGGESGRATVQPAPTTGEAPALRALRTVGGARPAIVDAAGRQVLLRGVNVNALGDYFAAAPDLPSVEPLTDQDWDDMAAQGFSAVRLIMSWSALEPHRGQIDAGYIARLKDAVSEAGERGIYVVLDMHQDAWGKFIATPAGVDCADGTERAIGWDGAPEWATLTNGESTCRYPGARELAPAVFRAFNNFYDNVDGIQDEFVRVWTRVAREFAHNPAVAGYDLLNEPNMTDALEPLHVKYTALIDRTIRAIRAAERRADGISHIVFVEPIVTFPLPLTVPDVFGRFRNLAFSPHNYWEAIGDQLTIEQGMELSRSTADSLGAPLWIGEYGWWDTSTPTLAKVRRYAAAEDAALAASQWWQWRQACGDPHSIGRFGGRPGDQYHYRTMRCPDRVDEGVTDEYARIVARPYPRATPGRLLKLRSDGEARTMRLVGRLGGAPADARLVVWVPDRGHGQPTVGGYHLAAVQISTAPGGWYVSARVTARYSLSIA